jgi:hypothetical protein
MKILYKKILFFLIVSIIAAVAPFGIHATSLSFSASVEKIYVGDIFVVDLKISSPDKSINTVEGSLFFDPTVLQAKDLSEAGSVFNTWAESPKFSNESGLITFVAGAPNGFKGAGGQILKVIFQAKKAGSTQLTPTSDFTVFLNNGLGTKDNFTTSPSFITVLNSPAGYIISDQWKETISDDKTPPQKFQIYLGKNPFEFNGKYFISFSATDKDSGIDRYEVREGDRKFTWSTSPYVLIDQSLKSVIEVKAIDKAGNERVVKYSKLPSILFVIMVILITAILVIILYLYKKPYGKQKT